MRHDVRRDYCATIRGEKRIGWCEKKKKKKGLEKRSRDFGWILLGGSGFGGKRAWTEMQIWPGCPLAFYRINVRPIRRTTIFNGSSHNGLLCAVKAQSLGEGRGDREQAFSRKCDPDKSGIASRRALSPHGFFDKMAHCCVSIFLFLLTSLSLTPSPSLFSSLFFLLSSPSFLAIFLLLVLTRFSLATSIPSHCSRNLVLSPFI